MNRIAYIALLLVVVATLPVQAQESLGFFERPDTLNKKRLKGLIVFESVGYAGSMYGLHQIWYKNQPRTSFHFFNDNDEWLGMDKVGHSVTSYYIGKAGIEMLRWTGVEDDKAIWYGGNLGLLYLTTLELFDGYSEGWGASLGDMIANVSGTALLIGQELGWGEQRLQLKFSSHLTDFADYRPAVLGSTFPERILKDYNGQTYWLSGNVHSFLNESSRFPQWLNIAVGYGADGMTGGDYNPLLNEAGMAIPSFDRRRQYYLSLDVDLTKIRTRSGFLKALFGTVNFIKIPAPALELNEGGTVKVYGVYF